MKRLIFTFLLSSSFFYFLNAQVTPPTFQCIRGDTLFWEVPINNCGPFVSYDIYTSGNLNGPYTLLSSVTNPTQDFFDDPNPAGELRYYYLVSNFDCPGEPQPTSDTLDSRLPQISPLRSIGVLGTDVVLNWQFSPSPEVYAYIIYRRDPIGVIPIDTVFGGVATYVDSNAEPDMESEGYFVNALDRCGNTSIFDQEHKTIFLEGEPTDCSVDLNWNLYQNWGNGIGSQEVWVGVNGGAPTLNETLDVSTSSYSFRNVNDGDSYCFFIQAMENGTGEMSRSNEICFNNLSVAQPVNELYITNASVQSDNSVAIDWGINGNADVELLEYRRSDASGFLEMINSEMPTSPFPVSNQFLDQNADVGNGPLSYILHVEDKCSNELTTPAASTIFLNGDALDVSTNQLQWTPLVVENVTVTGYKIIRIINNAENEIGSVNAGSLTFEDEFTPSSISSGTICYVIEAAAIVTLPNGTGRNIVSRSNKFCLDQAIRIFVPNAFAPNGINQEFKPVILSGKIAKYEMQVFDRYGSIVFKADSPDEGWKGKKDGKGYPQGVYVYRIHIVLENGKETEKKGHVLLLR